MPASSSIFSIQTSESRKEEQEEMEIPVINFADLEGEKRGQTLALLHHACEKWGFFQALDRKDGAFESNWESSFFIWHRPKSNIHDFVDFSEEFCKTTDNYIDQLVKVAEKLAELMSENLGLEKDFIKKSFSGNASPAVGTKVAKYPECPRPELVRGLREHTDAGGIILLLQDDQVPGLEFYKDEQWVKIPPTKNNRLFVNTGDQLEVLSNGKYRSILHRVMAVDKGSRLSIATFYNPSGDAIISPAPKLMYPSSYRFQDYLTKKMKIKGSVPMASGIEYQNQFCLRH